MTTGSIRSLLIISFRSWCTDTTYFILNNTSVFLCVCVCTHTYSMLHVNRNPARHIWIHHIWILCEHRFLDFLITNGHLHQSTSLWKKTIEEVCSCHIFPIPAALKELGLGFVCCHASEQSLVSGCAAELQIFCLVSLWLSTGRLHSKSHLSKRAHHQQNTLIPISMSNYWIVGYCRCIKKCAYSISMYHSKAVRYYSNYSFYFSTIV